ncbi:hypothetical protein [Brevibacillus parabrevis]|uniref:hypothetical protein n=1 Tax=Brevibacillus parabrevis TaxID=54914 RepID=UPI002E232BC0|nr:hypothetical protein [Brevibacillus parabrevis]
MKTEVTGVRVNDSLEYLSEATRQAILNEQTRRFRLDQKQQDLSSRLLDSAFISRVWQEADELERTVIKLFLTKAPRGFFSKRTWERETAKEHRHLSIGLTRLRRLGLILTVRKMWSEIGYVMPQEIREQLTMQLLPPLTSAYVSLSKTLPYYISAGRGIHLDLFGLLLFVRDQQVPVTQKGSIHRRAMQKMLPLLSIADEHVQGIALAPLDKEQREGLALTIVLDLAFRLGLVMRKEKQLVPDSCQIRQWLNQSSPERFEQLYQLVADQLLPHGDWWDAFAQMMRHVPLDQWCCVDAQLRMLETAGFVLPEEAEKAIVEQWLHILLGMGWIQLGADDEERLFWRWNSLPHLTAEEGWFVDPTGALTIPPLVPLRDVWEISAFCQLTFEGQLIRGELQAGKLQSYLASGGTKEQVIEKLRSGCAHPLPDSLVEVIGHWAKTATQIQLEPFYRVRTAHGGFVEEWRQIPDFQPFLQHVLPPAEFFIPLSQKRQLIDLLKHYGYEPHVVMQTDAADGEEDTLPDVAARGLLLIERPWDGYAIENTFPAQDEAMPQLATLPKMWTQHFQSYHPQSLRDLLKRAAELQLEVEIQLTDQERLHGLPVEVKLDMGYWVVSISGPHGKRSYRLDDLGRVRIVVPDYLY